MCYLIFPQKRDMLLLTGYSFMLKQGGEWLRERGLVAIQRFQRGGTLCHIRAMATACGGGRFKLAVSRVDVGDAQAPVAAGSSSTPSLKEYEEVIKSSIMHILKVVAGCVAAAEVVELSVILQLDKDFCIWVVEFEQCIYRPIPTRIARPQKSSAYAGNLRTDTHKTTGEIFRNLSYVDLSSDVQNIELHQLVMPDRLDSSALVLRDDAEEARGASGLRPSRVLRKPRSGIRSVPEINLTRPAACNGCAQTEHPPAAMLRYASRGHIERPQLPEGDESPYLHGCSSSSSNKQLVVELPRTSCMEEAAALADCGETGTVPKAGKASASFVFQKRVPVNDLAVKRSAVRPPRHAVTQSMDLSQSSARRLQNPSTNNQTPSRNPDNDPARPRNFYGCSIRKNRVGRRARENPATVTATIVNPYMCILEGYRVAGRKRKTCKSEPKERPTQTATGSERVGQAGIQFCPGPGADGKQRLALKYMVQRPKTSAYAMIRRAASAIKGPGRCMYRGKSTLMCPSQKFLVTGQNSFYVHHPVTQG